MRAAGARLRAVACAALCAGLLAPLLSPSSAAAAPVRVQETSASVKAQIAALNAEMDRVAEQLAEGARAYEEAEARLGRLTQEQFAATENREALLDAEADTRQALSGLARAAYKGGVPPMLTAIMSGNPRVVSDLAYVQRSVNTIGATHSDLSRELVTKQIGAGRAVQRSDALRREALKQRQDLEAMRVQLAARTTELTADLNAAGARLLQVHAKEQAIARAKLAAEQLAAADRAAAAAAAAAALARQQAAAAGLPLPSETADGGAGLCQPPTGLGEVNGFLSETSLCPLQTAPGHRLRTDAARAFDALSRARQEAVGAPLCVTDSYRSYAAQVDVFRRKPDLAATPGRSQHGWGLAVDLGCGVQGFGSEAHRWMQANAGAYGWIHPRWAQQGGSKPEAWHWEFVGTVPAAR